MRIAIAVAGLLLVVLQGQLWLGERSWPQVWERQSELERLQAKQEELAERNRELRAELRDLRSGDAALEERAREELGMVRPEEIFIRIVRPRAQPPAQGRRKGPD
jgi:cell division protein FtsB